MPFIKTKKVHKCKTPGTNHPIAARWYCPVCKMIWQMEDDQRNGPYWMATGVNYTDPKMSQ